MKIHKLASSQKIEVSRWQGLFIQSAHIIVIKEGERNVKKKRIVNGSDCRGYLNLLHICDEPSYV